MSEPGTARTNLEHVRRPATVLYVTTVDKMAEGGDSFLPDSTLTQTRKAVAHVGRSVSHTPGTE